jgi:membrane protein implicated in regulation of membrane protease activity
MAILEPTQAELFEHPLDGVVVTVIMGCLSGQVNIMSVTWLARLCVPDPRYVLPPGTPVSVVGRRGNTVLVLPYWV